MTAFEELNPFVVLIYYLAVLFISMFSQNPVTTAIAFIGALIYLPQKSEIRAPYKKALLIMGLIVVMSIVNPLVSHNGRTVLFVLNNNPVTLEALFYGVNQAFMIASVLIRFSAFNRIMTSDRLLYVFSGCTPKLALTLSMILRFIPMFTKQFVKIKNAQKAMGQVADKGIAGKLKENAAAFSILVTWALENGIITAKSMEARGFGESGRRTAFARYRMHLWDAAAIVIILILTGITMVPYFAGASFSFYPDIIYNPGRMDAIGFAAFGILMIIPVVTDLYGAIKWKLLIARN